MRIHPEFDSCTGLPVSEECHSTCVVSQLNDLYSAGRGHVAPSGTFYWSHPEIQSVSSDVIFCVLYVIRENTLKITHRIESGRAPDVLYQIFWGVVVWYYIIKKSSSSYISRSIDFLLRCFLTSSDLHVSEVQGGQRPEITTKPCWPWWVMPLPIWWAIPFGIEWDYTCA